MPVQKPGLGSTTPELNSYSPYRDRSTAGREPGEGEANRCKEKDLIKISPVEYLQKTLKELFIVENNGMKCFKVNPS